MYASIKIKLRKGIGFSIYSEEVYSSEEVCEDGRCSMEETNTCFQKMEEEMKEMRRRVDGTFYSLRRERFNY